MNIPASAAERSDVIQKHVKKLMKSEGITYQEAFAMAQKDPEIKPIFDAMSWPSASGPGGTGKTTMNALATKGGDGKKQPGKVYPGGFAGGPQVNALRAAGDNVI